MSKKLTYLLLFVIVLLLLGGALIYASVKKPKAARSGPSQNSNRAEANRASQVKRVAIWQQLRPALNQLGDRLEHAGKERLIINGTLKEAGENGASQIQLVIQLPDQVRLLRQHGASRQVLTFDGDLARTRGNQLDDFQLGLIESLAYDSPEHFFIRETEGVPTRGLGSRFRMADGSFSDVYQISDQSKLDGTLRSITKYYSFNTETQLLNMVRYEIVRNGSPVKVETHLEKWRRENGTAIPGRITRIENGVTVFTLVVSSSSLGSRAEDGIFTNP